MEAKFAEKLVILNSHAYGLCCRLHRVKQAFETSKPECLAEKSFDQHVRQHIKKFPLVEIPKGQGTPLGSKKDQILQQLEDAYYTIVDLLELKASVMELVTSISAQMMHLDISLNFDLTSQFLTLMANLVSLFILLSRIEDRRVIASVYSSAYEASKGAREPSFARLGQLLVDYDEPLRTLHKDFMPHTKVVSECLLSLQPEVIRRHLSADMLRKNHSISILHNHAKLAQPVEADHIMTEFMSVANLTRWVGFGYLLVPNELHAPDKAQEHMAMLELCIKEDFATPVFRTETINLFQAFETVIASLRDAKKLGKLKAQFADLQQQNVAAGIEYHANRRLFLRHTLRQMWNLLQDKPGLLGPKAPLFLAGLTMAKDEVLWLYRHIHVQPPKCKIKPNMQLLKDPNLPELLFLIAEIRVMFLQYREVVKKYHEEFLTGADSAALAEALPKLSLQPTEQNALGAVHSAISNLSAAPTSLQGLRLDWVRLQASMSTQSAASPLDIHPAFAETMSLISFHSSMYDDLDKVLHTATDLSGLWFYKRTFVDMFNLCLASNEQQRFAAAFASVCDSFSRCTTDFVPEERQEIGKDAANMANFFLGKIAAKAASSIHEMAMQHVQLGQQVLPTKAAAAIAQRASKQSKGKGPSAHQPPGLESQARSKEQVQSLRALQQGLSNLCWALNHSSTIVVFNYVFTPKEYLTELMEKSFGESLLRLVRAPDGTMVRPSVCLANVKSYMAALRSIENYINIDVSSIFSSGFLDQSLYMDTAPGTVATVYIKFYIELISSMKTSHGIFVSPCRKSFVSKSGANLRAEQFTDVTELRALCTLLGPFGIKQLDSQLLNLILINVTEMKKLTLFNRDHLEAIKASTENAQLCVDAVKHLKETDTFVADALAVGVVLEFRRLMYSALSAVLEARIPFIFRAISDLHAHTNAESVDLLALSAGIRSVVDPQLKDTLKEQSANTDADFNAWSLMMVFFASSVRQFGASSLGYRSSLEAFENNAQVLSTTVNELSTVLFSLCAAVPEEVDASIREAQTEFLRISATLLLRLGSPLDRDAPRGRDAMLLVIDRFVSESKVLTADVLQKFVPYGLIRTGYTNLHKKRSSKGRASKGDDTGF